MSITQTGHMASIGDPIRHAIDVNLTEALRAAGASALGFPGSVDTFRHWLEDHGLTVTLLKVLQEGV
jgi:hypothetical protein